MAATAEDSFGIDHRTLRELRQTQAGTAFFLQALWTLASHLAFGGLFVEEHPGIPLKALHPSVWKSALSKFFRNHPDIVLHEIAQCKSGAATVKPTGLMTPRLPFFIRDLFSQADECAIRPRSHAIGADEPGEFRKACHKEYPLHACLQVLHALWRTNYRGISGHEQHKILTALQHPSYNEVARECGHIRSEATWLPDYQG